jgi:hypothetical protein
MSLALAPRCPRILRSSNSALDAGAIIIRELYGLIEVILGTLFESNLGVLWNFIVARSALVK